MKLTAYWIIDVVSLNLYSILSKSQHDRSFRTLTIKRNNIMCYIEILNSHFAQNLCGIHKSYQTKSFAFAYRIHWISPTQTHTTINIKCYWHWNQNPIRFMFSPSSSFRVPRKRIHANQTDITYPERKSAGSAYRMTYITQSWSLRV